MHSFLSRLADVTLTTAAVDSPETAPHAVVGDAASGASAKAAAAPSSSSGAAGDAEDPDGPVLDISTVAPNPMDQFALWFREASDKGLVPREGVAMTLATCTTDGFPSARIVLLKGFDSAGFRFFTNYESRKGQELGANPRAALVIHWPGMFSGRQVRVEGDVHRVSSEESDEYFGKRPRDARIGAWSSPQSAAIPDRATLQHLVDGTAERFKEIPASDPLPRPPFWGGFLVVPRVIEFWRSGGASRLHDRVVYTREGARAGVADPSSTEFVTALVTHREWTLTRLAP